MLKGVLYIVHFSPCTHATRQNVVGGFLEEAARAGDNDDAPAIIRPTGVDVDVDADGLADQIMQAIMPELATSADIVTTSD
eukprot:m.70236 g.70236  ORF g.70236 m.70236 type:complete len:81 (-) comp12252_c0_seq3:4528-4770(-)